MANNTYRKEYGNDDGVLNNGDYQPAYSSNEGYNGDAEKGPKVAVEYNGKEDPFGDETNSEVKYRTMAWW